ncbi:hypothetical protein CDEST_13493 [Colletotrichum destructivum]|uniref:Uncharacterized protein n=1 Tax=Colletotrichum destructivum TaxID=34406 RepID=A0AAX4IYW2_9PEZI|nr:hypothetical protein CDEST_13493 [Colletotrichum destructivum]
MADSTNPDDSRMTEDTVAIAATPSTVTDESASLEQRKNVLVNELMEIFTIGERGGGGYVVAVRADEEFLG